jgi:hypothetical protein
MQDSCPYDLSRPTFYILMHNCKRRGGDMIQLVIIEKLTPEGRRDFKKVLEWQKRFDEWLMSHGATWRSVKHFITEIGEPVYETWLEYPNYTALDEDDEKTKEFAQQPEFLELISPMSKWFERKNSRILKEIQ